MFDVDSKLWTRTSCAVDRGDIDNGPAVGHMPQLCPHTVHAACQVDRHDLVPFVVVQLGNRPASVVLSDNTGNVCGSIQSTKLGHDAFDPGVDLGSVRHVHAG